MFLKSVFAHVFPQACRHMQIPLAWSKSCLKNFHFLLFYILNNSKGVAPGIPGFFLRPPIHFTASSHLGWAGGTVLPVRHSGLLTSLTQNSTMATQIPCTWEFLWIFWGNFCEIFCGIFMNFFGGIFGQGMTNPLPLLQCTPTPQQVFPFWEKSLNFTPGIFKEEEEPETSTLFSL